MTARRQLLHYEYGYTISLVVIYSYHVFMLFDVDDIYFLLLHRVGERCLEASGASAAFCGRSVLLAANNA